MSPDEINLRIVEIVRQHHIEEAHYNEVTLAEGNDYGIPAGVYVFGQDGKWTRENYCCAMRKHYLLGILGERTDEPRPPEAVDFVYRWSPKIVLSIRYCPFCGEKLTADQTMRG